jgi:hypothetical protein
LWFWKKSEAKNVSNVQGSILANVERFLHDYERAGKDRTRYAMALWGINEAFLEIFGSFDGYHGADKAKRNRYLTMIANNAIESLETGNDIEASCNQAFVNFLAATEGYSRRQLIGSLENVADRIDGIVRFGKAEIDRIGRMEGEVKEFLAQDASYAIGSGVVQGAVSERNVVLASQLIIAELQKVLRTHEDYHRYIIEQYARLKVEPGIRTLLDSVPMFEIELSTLGKGWSKDSPPGLGVSCIDGIRPQLRHWCQVTVPSLDPGELSLRIIGAAYGHFRNTGKSNFDEIRAGYAKQFQEQCIRSGYAQAAAAWGKVVRELAP